MYNYLFYKLIVHIFVSRYYKLNIILMIKLDFSHLHENGFMINQLRLFYTSKFRGLNFMKHKNAFIKSEDLTGEKNLLLEYIIQRMEICYTQYIVFATLTFIILGLGIISVLFVFDDVSMVVRLSLIGFMIVSWFVAKKGKENFVMAHVGYGLTESIYDFKIKEKYNL